MKPRHIAAIDQRRPPVEIAHMRLAADAATQSFQVALDGREPLLQACPRQIRREPAVESPRPLFGAVQVGHDATSDNLKSKTHARQKPIELLVAQLDLPG